MRKLLLLFLVLGLQTSAQVPMTNVVEHFTNTYCSICANRNPGFYGNVNNQSNTIYLSVHPSSPYVACLLSQQNKIDNDARTNYYGIFGATPRIVINGDPIDPNLNYSSPSIFTPYFGMTSPVEMRVEQFKYGNDSLLSLVTIKRVAVGGPASASLFLGLAEDTILYTGGNGEPKHYNVLRKAVLGAAGQSITLPALPGDSVQLSGVSVRKSIWNFNRMLSIAILQDNTTKALIQSAKSTTAATILTTGLSENKQNSLRAYPVPSNGILYLDHVEQGDWQHELYDAMGRKVFEGMSSGTASFDFSLLPKGVYHLRSQNKEQVFTQKIILSHP